MTKNPNRNPNKGFADELSRAVRKQQPDAPNKQFTWAKPVVNPVASDALNTPRRISSNASVRAPQTNIAQDAARVAARRRGAR